MPSSGRSRDRYERIRPDLRAGAGRGGDRDKRDRRLCDWRAAGVEVGCRHALVVCRPRPLGHVDCRAAADRLRSRRAGARRAAPRWRPPSRRSAHQAASRRPRSAPRDSATASSAIATGRLAPSSCKTSGGRLRRPPRMGWRTGRWSPNGAITPRPAPLPRRRRAPRPYRRAPWSAVATRPIVAMIAPTRNAAE